MFTSDVEQRKQRSQNKRENEHNSDKTKKNFTGSYTEVNPIFEPRLKDLKIRGKTCRVYYLTDR